jgi:hypothetical protein
LGEPVIQVINDQQILSKENPSEQKLSILRESEAKYRGKKG